MNNGYRHWTAAFNNFIYNQLIGNSQSLITFYIIYFN
jgi:hypothetical protein